MTDRARAIPLLARIAGLDTSVLEPLTSSSCAAQAAVIVSAEQALEIVRSQLVDKLYKEILGAPDELRRLLLAVKRDSFNRRSIAKHAKAPLWLELCRRIGPLAEQAITLEQQIGDQWGSFRTRFESESDRQTRDLFQLVLGEKGLQRGIALAGPAMIEDLRRFGDLRGRPVGRKQRKLAVTLSRYVSRAALKLSPNSTLTRTALGTIRQDCGDELKLLGPEWLERSSLRLRRIYVDQWRDLLLGRPEFRISLRIALNRSAQEIEPGRFRWLRPGRWERNAEGTDLCFVQDALVTARLDSRVFRCTMPRLAEGASWTSTALLAALAVDEDVETNVASTELNRLLDLGFLHFCLPWTEDEPHAERRLLEHLRTLPCFETVTDLLEELVALQLAYSTTTPEWALQQMATLGARITRSLGELSGLDLKPVAEYRRGRLYEDVLLCAESGPGDLVQVSQATMLNASASVEPLIGLAYLYSHRHDFLHALKEFLCRQFIHQKTVAFLDVFSTAQPLWRQYSRFMAAASETSDGWRSTFNPSGNALVAHLDRLRQAIWDGLGSCVEDADDAEVLSGAALTHLLSPVPERYSPLVGLCLFLQPLDDRGENWFLNRMHEGVGRYGSRFSATMDESTRSNYTDHLASRSPFVIDGEPVELLDLLCAQGDTLNVHAVQTRWVLDVHGNGFAPSAPGNRLCLRDLRVEIDGPRGLPWLTDAEGRRFLPVHLGGASHAFMPTVIKFLSLFGPGEFRSVWPPRRPRIAGEAEILERLRIGNVFFGRKRWSFPPRMVAEQLSAPDPEAYVALQRWRMRHGIPERVFLRERILHRVLADRFKPQYLDLSSPLCVPVLRAAIESSSDAVSFEEMLPDPQILPADRNGRRWGVELLLDSFALRPRRDEETLEPAGAPRPLASIPSQPEPATAHL